jgi:hypothetical protein
MFLANHQVDRWFCRSAQVVGNLREKVDASREAVPVVAALRNPALKERHWVKIQAAVGSEIARTEGVTLGSVLAQEVVIPPHTFCCKC